MRKIYKKFKKKVDKFFDTLQPIIDAVEYGLELISTVQ